MSTVNDHDQGVSINRIEHRTSKIEMRINSALIGPWPKHILVRFIGSEKLNDLQPNAETKKVDGWKSKSKSKTRTATIQRVLLVSAATSKYHIRTAVHSILPTASTATQPHRPPRKQPAGEPQHQPRRSRAFVSRRSSLSEHSLRKIEDDTPENEVGSSFSV